MYPDKQLYEYSPAERRVLDGDVGGPVYPLKGSSRFCDASTYAYLDDSTLYGDDSIIGMSVLLEEAGGRVKHD